MESSNTDNDLRAQASAAAAAAISAQSNAEAAAAAAVMAQQQAQPAAIAAAEAKSKSEASATASEGFQVTAAAAAKAAVAAQAIADPAGVASTSAQSKAEASAAAANTAKEQAEAASVATVAAQNVAEPAATASATAQSKAEAAANAAITARETAEPAAAAAHAAQLKAEPSATAAATAQARAEKAAENADKQLQSLRQTLENSITASLGGAFQKKADNAKILDLVWLVVLFFGIGLILWIGYLRYPAMLELIQNKAAVEYMVFQLILNGIALSGPVWLTWVATRRLSNIFVISEDYAYKAAIAQAYQGYRDSVKDGDPLMAQRLFSTVVTQLDANPTRFVSDKHPGSPLQDLLQQPWMIEKMNDPTFREKFITWFRYKYSKVFEVPKE